MRIGYACILLTPRGPGLKTCTAKNADPAKLRALIAHNLAVLAAMLDYNRRHGIRLLRVSSDIIPFGSSPVNQLP